MRSTTTNNNMVTVESRKKGQNGCCRRQQFCFGVSRFRVKKRCFQHFIMLLLLVGAVINTVFIKSVEFSEETKKFTIGEAQIRPFKSNNKSASNTTNSIHDDDHSKNTSFWPSLASRLCPNMIPQSHYFSKVFKIARQELNVSTTCDYPDTMSTGFIAHHKWFGTSATEFHHHRRQLQEQEREQANDVPIQGKKFTKTSVVGVMYIWKNANNEIRRHWVDVFEQSPQREIFSVLNNETSMNTHPVNICLVVAIRDPISHFQSAYNEIEYRIEEEKVYRTSWDFGKKPKGSNERFETFVSELVSCPSQSTSRDVWGSGQRFFVYHVNSMTSVLSKLANTQAVRKNIVNLQEDLHYLPSLANLSKVWGPFVLKSCGGGGSEDFQHGGPNAVFPSHIVQKLLNTTVPKNEHLSSLDHFGFYAAAKRVWKEQGRTARALCAIHVIDFACWRDLPDGVPDFCMNLYRSYAEKKLI